MSRNLDPVNHSSSGQPLDEKPPGRREAKRRRTVEALLDAAERVFARSGFGGASVDAVAEEASLTKGAVYWNFPSKEEMFLAVFDRRLQQDQRDIQSLIESGIGSDQFIEVMIERHRNFVKDADGWALLNVEFWLYAMRNPEAQAAYAARWREARAAVSRLFEPELAARGVENPQAQAKELAALLIGVDMGVGMQARIDPEDVPAEVYGRGLRLLSE